MKLTREIGCVGDVTLERLSGGRNNQTFKLKVDNRKFLLKSYFVHDGDLRDRLGREFSFLRFAWDKEIRCIPQPLVADKKQHVALYEFIDGERLKRNDIVEDFIKQAIRFAVQLNKYKDTNEARLLPLASEACFSISEHLNCVEHRLKRLEEIDPCDSVGKKAGDFFWHELVPCWRKLKEDVSERIGNSGIHIDKIIDYTERCLSPSDFGFHNALCEPTRKLRFIDFEYAGWDDPAKLVCDFFCQPQIPVEMDYFSLFLDEITQSFAKDRELKERIAILLPVYRIKWCSIMLNEFIPEGYARRSYAEKYVETQRKEEQLEKVKIYLAETLKYCLNN